MLGLLKLESPRIEGDDELLARVDEAAQYLPVEQLAISPQCGFASRSALDGVDGNELDRGHVAAAKLEVQARVVERALGLEATERGT